MSHKHTATVATKKKTCTQRFTEEARVFCPNKEILSARPVCHTSTRRLFRQKKNQARVKRVAEVHVVSSFFFHLAPSVFQKHTSSVQTTTKKRIHHVSGLGQKHTSNKKTRCIARHRSMSRLLQSISSRLFFVLGAGDNQVNAEEMKARNTKISGKLMFSAKNGVLSAFLREDEATLRLR